MSSVPANSYKLYRIWLNSAGEGVSATGGPVYYSLEQAQQAVIDKWVADNCKQDIEWKAVNQFNGKTVASKRAA